MHNSSKLISRNLRRVNDWQNHSMNRDERVKPSVKLKFRTYNKKDWYIVICHLLSSVWNNTFNVNMFLLSKVMSFILYGIKSSHEYLLLVPFSLTQTSLYIEQTQIIYSSKHMFVTMHLSKWIYTISIEQWRYYGVYRHALHTIQSV